MKKTKALVLLSGGLDSMLAVCILMDQGIEVAGLTFESNFYNADKARLSARELKIPIKVVDIGKDMLSLVKNPPSGYGKYMNPCIDCHAMMFRKAGQIAKKEKYDFIASGEVLGQRPFSQTKNALRRIVNLSGADILRPLSAKLLGETKAEKDGLVNRERLLDISGRARNRQIELARKYKIKNFPGPAGGCLLTAGEFSRRLQEMIHNWPECDRNDVELLKNGRTFWINGKILIVVARNREECDNLESLAKKGDILIKLKEMEGPLTLVRVKSLKLKVKSNLYSIKVPKEMNMEDLSLNNRSDEEILNIAATLTGWYEPDVRGREVELKVESI